MSKFYLILLFICLLPLKTYASENENTHFCERDCSMEYNFFRKYARQGSSLANLSMAIMNYQGHGRDQNINLANKQLISAARAGEPAAMYQLAYNLMFGVYITQNLEKSLVWFKKANKNAVVNSSKFITLLNNLLQIENEKTKSSMKNMLSENMNTEERSVTIQESNESIERISVTQQFYWSFLLYNAKLQTCYINCTIGSSHTMIPVIHVINEEALLGKIRNLAKDN
jgi:hypothetical protein